MKLRIVFAGTPDFAAICLERLLQTSHEIIAVYTQPDRPSGRGLKLTPPPVKLVAHQYQIPCYQVSSLKDNTELDRLRDWQFDVMVVAAYGLFLPANILNLPRLGCVNIHPSLLPRWRGAAPIQRAIYSGDKVTGVTIMQMDTGLDTGPILSQRQYVLDHDETSQSLHDALAKVGAEALIETLDQLALGKITPIVQDASLATYAHKITKEEALIDWELPAETLEHHIRAFNPWPVAYTSWQGKNLRIWFAKALNEKHQRAPRTILDFSRHGLDVAAGSGVLRLLKLQLPGGKMLSASDFYNAKCHEIIVGEHLI